VPAGLAPPPGLVALIGCWAGLYGSQPCMQWDKAGICTGCECMPFIPGAVCQVAQVPTVPEVTVAQISAIDKWDTSVYTQHTQHAATPAASSHTTHRDFRLIIQHHPVGPVIACQQLVLARGAVYVLVCEPTYKELQARPDSVPSDCHRSRNLQLQPFAQQLVASHASYTSCGDGPKIIAVCWIEVGTGLQKCRAALRRG
jgi:hypothetical protein